MFKTTKEAGVFETDPNAAVILMPGFKTGGHDLWPIVLSQLGLLRRKGWLTYFNGIDIVLALPTINQISYQICLTHGPNLAKTHCLTNGRPS